MIIMMYTLAALAGMFAPTKTTSPRGRRILATGGTRNGKTLDYRRRAHNWGPSTIGWDDRVWIEMTHERLEKANAFILDPEEASLDYFSTLEEERKFLEYWAEQEAYVDWETENWYKYLQYQWDYES
jgi:hypothetical protein